MLMTSALLPAFARHASWLSAHLHNHKREKREKSKDTIGREQGLFPRLRSYPKFDRPIGVCIISVLFSAEYRNSWQTRAPADPNHVRPVEDEKVVTGGGGNPWRREFAEEEGATPEGGSSRRKREQPLEEGVRQGRKERPLEEGVGLARRVSPKASSRGSMGREGGGSPGL